MLDLGRKPKLLVFLTHRLKYYLPSVSEKFLIVKGLIQSMAHVVIGSFKVKARSEFEAHMSCSARKTVFEVYDQVRHKPAYTVTEKG